MVRQAHIRETLEIHIGTKVDWLAGAKLSKNAKAQIMQID